MGVGSDAGNSGWVAGDDWYTRVEVTWDSNETRCIYTATVKVYSAYWTNRNSGVNYSINIAGNVKSGSVGSPGITPGNWATIATHSATVYRNHSSQTFAISGWVGASSGASSYTSGATAWWPASSHPLGALSSYAVSFNANGGSNAPGGQTKWYNESLTLTTAQPTRDGHTFKGWATSAGGAVAYSPGSAYTANSAITLYAVWQVWTYTVSYNANGGSGAPGNQTKTWGQNLTLSSTKPTRSLYNFKGWATSSGSTSANYQPGGTYSTNANLTLYAVWEVAWVAPRITGVSVYRSDASKNASDDGTYITVKFNWATDNTVSAVTATIDGTAQTISASGKSGSVSEVYGTYSAESSHTVVIKVADNVGGSTLTYTVESAHYIMDFSPVGAVGINTVANSSSKRVDVNAPVYVSGALSASGNATVGGALSVGSTAKVGVATTSTHSLPSLSGSGKWMKLGWWSDNADSNNLIIDLYTGNGYNGNVYQNTHARIFVKNGSQGTQSQAVGAFGGTLQAVSGDGTDASGMRLALPASAHNCVDVYVYFPWQYVNGWMQVSCNGGTWHADVKEANYPTSGYTLQNVGWTAPVVSGLYWGTTLLGGRVGVKLWSGTLSKGGSITVSDLNRYRVLAVETSLYNELALMVNRNDSIYMSAGNSVDDGTTTYTYRATFQKTSNTGTTLVLRSASRHQADGSNGTVMTVKAIWGLI